MLGKLRTVDIELLNCPFCNGKVEMVEEPLFHTFSICCTKCDGDFRFFGVDKKPEELARKFNTRAVLDIKEQNSSSQEG